MRQRVVEAGQPVVGELVGPGVDQVQLEVVAGEDPRQLQPDVADAEDRHGGHHRERLEQQRHLTAAALPAVVGARLVGERDDQRLGLVAAGSSGARARATAVSSRLPPPTLPHVSRRGDDHLGAGLARCVPAYVGER